MRDQKAQQYTGVTPEELVDWQVPRDLTISAKGHFALYALHDKYKHPHQAFKSSIWIATTGHPDSARQLTEGTFNDRSPQFGPGEASITFVSDRYSAGDSCAIYQLAIETKTGVATSSEPSPLTPAAHKRPIAQYAWSPKGDVLAYIAADEETSEQAHRKSTLDDANVFGKNPAFGRLVLVDVQKGDTRTLVQGEFHVVSFVWSSSGQELLYTTTKSVEPLSARQNGVSFSRVRVADGYSHGICEFPGSVEGIPIWLGDSILFRAGKTPGRSNSAIAVYTLTISSGEWKRIACGEDNDAAILAPIATHSLAAAVVQQGLYDHVELLDERGSKRKIGVYGDYIIDAISFTQSGGILTAAAIMAKDCSPWEIFSWTCKEGTHPGDLSKLSNHSKKLDKAYVRTVRPFSCSATDGQTLNAVLITPPHTTCSEPKGTIINIHGGPYERSSFVFDPTMYCWAPLFVSIGCAVLCPNYRGSSGYGDAFASAPIGNMGTRDYADIVDMVHAAIKQGLIASDKIMVAGWSRGGFLSFTASTRREFPLRGAICGAGITDWDMLCMSSDAPVLEKGLAGTAPWQAVPADVSARQGSPVWHMAQMDKRTMVPLLLLHGEADVRVPMTQSVGFHRGCREYEWPCQFVTYPREPHVFVEREHALDMLRRVAEFVLGGFEGSVVLGAGRLSRPLKNKQAN